MLDLVLLLLPLGVAAPPPQTLRVSVFVPLCDGAALSCGGGGLGDPHEPAHNLYWGAQYGNDRMLRRHPEWTLTSSAGAVDRCRLATRTYARAARAGETAVEVELHAYDGTCMAEALDAFLRASGGETRAQLVVWAGHDGLMDLDAPRLPRGTGVATVALACLSNRYMAPAVRAAGGRPLVMTDSLMAPEGYLLLALLHEAARSGVDAPRRHHEALSRAYATFQHIPLPAARRVFVVPGP